MAGTTKKSGNKENGKRRVKRTGKEFDQNTELFGRHNRTPQSAQVNRGNTESVQRPCNDRAPQPMQRADSNQEFDQLVNGLQQNVGSETAQIDNTSLYNSSVGLELLPDQRVNPEATDEESTSNEEMDEMDSEISDDDMAARENVRIIQIKTKNLPSKTPSRHRREQPYVDSKMVVDFSQIELPNQTKETWSKAFVQSYVESLSENLWASNCKHLSLFDRGVLCGMAAKQNPCLIKSNNKMVGPPAKRRCLDKSGLVSSIF